jgi:hypothetical protein
MWQTTTDCGLGQQELWNGPTCDDNNNNNNNKTTMMIMTIPEPQHGINVNE